MLMRNIVLFGTMMIAACTSTPENSDKGSTAAGAGQEATQPQSCDAAPAQFAVGQSYTDALAEQARGASGAKTVRKLMPGQAVTMEYRGDRLNIEVNEAGTVVRVLCG